MADDAAAAFEAAGDDWGIAASSLIRAIGAAHAGDVSAVTAAASVGPPSRGRGRIRRVSRAGAAARSVGGRETRGGRGRGRCVPARVRARRANRIRRPRGVRSRRRSERSLSRSGDPRKAEELERQALATAEAAQATLVAAQARVHLARIAAASGNADEADRLYREVLEWSTVQRPHQARESLFVALAGNPATAAERGLAEIAEPRPDTALT